MKLKPRQIFRIARLVIQAIRIALDEVESAKGPQTPGGIRVTPDEAIDVAAAVLGTLIEPIAGIITDD